MNMTFNFAKRNLIEMSRDVLGYIFCVAFPILMLIIMSVVNESIPPQADMTIFRIDNLLGGIIIFGQTFLMLFTALTVSKDRSGAFLLRLYATPYKSSNFTHGYILPMIIVGIFQCIISVVAASIISIVIGYKLCIEGVLLSVVISIPSAIMFISIGLIFGTILNQNAAPGLCSVIISLGSFIGGIWFDAEGVGGVILKIAKCFPFLYATKSVRSCIQRDYSMQNFMVPFMVVIVVAILLTILASMLFNRRMKADLS